MSPRLAPRLVWFDAPAGPVALALPFDLDEALSAWAGLRVAMARQLPEAFRRDEWAYLMSFLEKESLRDAFRGAFGTPRDGARRDGGARLLARPRGPVAVWLPSNVSLLGPLVLVLLSLSGNELWLKAASGAEDLTGAFLSFARERLADGELRRHLRERVRHARFDRRDARNAEYAARARMRVVFGSDESAAAVDALPHPLESVSFAFVDRRSEAWIAKGSADEACLAALLRVFAVYGQAGCTSPRRVVLLGADEREARAVRDRLLALWNEVVRGEPAPHVASGSVMARQWAAALGWDAALVPRNAAVLAAGARELERFEAPTALPIVGATLADALGELPANVQTIGHAVPDAAAPRWLEVLATSSVRRFVPLARMHHFGAVWDGHDFFRQAFELVEVDA